MNLDFLFALAEIYEWEIQSHVAFQTVTGRALYFGIVRAHLNGHQIDRTSLKQLVGSDIATERGVRLRMREFEKLGLVFIELNTVDKRTKRVLPTEQFVALMNAHASQAMLIFQRRFFIIQNTTPTSSEQS
ncbi:hypothetical protein [Limnohabitans sp.]|uniref:hypothetical protein n=1 Tax=Limnohabitans sp. TaxID=1907725 RepID=UPI00286F29FA|nr:hypothetical protein [Limnohabitans sp.]